MPRSSRLLITLISLLLPAHMAAQGPAPTARPDGPGTLRLFLDCETSGCDFDYFRTKITWVDYVRDRTAADVHVLVVSVGAGGGGSEVTLRFSGRDRFLGVDDEIRYSAAQGATSDERRIELGRFLALGLARYAARLPQGRNLAVTFTAPTKAAAAVPAADPWKLWVFSAGMNGYLSGESSSKSSDLGGSFSAGRTTADWKFQAYISGNKSENSFDLGDGSTYRSKVHSYYGSGLLVRSLGHHLSAGALFSGTSSTQENIDLNLRVAPTLEYSVFDYADYTKRRLTLQYSVGFNRYEYTETTIFDRDEETLVNQSLGASYVTRTTWGSASMSVSASQYLANLRQNRVTVGASANVRVFKGMGINYGGSYARVRDQITLPRDGASDEEILLRLKRLRTNYRYSAYFGLTYTFGSVLNNIVNPRLGGSGEYY